MNSWWSAQGRECWGNTEKNSGTLLDNSKKRIMAKFYSLVEKIERVVRKLAGSNYHWWKFWPKRSWDEKLRCLSELTLVVLGPLSTSTWILCSPAQGLSNLSPKVPGPDASLRDGLVGNACITEICVLSFYSSSWSAFSEDPHNYLVNEQSKYYRFYLQIGHEVGRPRGVLSFPKVL